MEVDLLRCVECPRDHVCGTRYGLYNHSCIEIESGVGGYSTTHSYIPIRRRGKQIVSFY